MHSFRNTASPWKCLSKKSRALLSFSSPGVHSCSGVWWAIPWPLAGHGTKGRMNVSDLSVPDVQALDRSLQRCSRNEHLADNLCLPADTKSFLGASWGQPFSRDSFVSEFSSVQLRDLGSLLTAGSETGALIQGLLNSMGLSRHQRMLDQGWWVWKALTRHGVWNQEIKLVERGRGGRRERKGFPWSSFLRCSTQHLNPQNKFSLCYWVLWGKQKSAMSHQRPGKYFSLSEYTQLPYLLSSSGALSASATWPCPSKPSHWPFWRTENALLSSDEQRSALCHSHDLAEREKRKSLLCEKGVNCCGQKNSSRQAKGIQRKGMTLFGSWILLLDMHL